MNNDLRAGRDRASLHAELDRLLDDVENIFAPQNDPNAREQWARVIMWPIMSFAGRIAGRSLLEAAYQYEWDEETGSESLEKLAKRFQYLAWLFESIDQRPATHSIDQAIVELSAIARGDAPKLFAGGRGTKGKQVASYRLAQKKLMALWWDEILRSAGAEVEERHETISVAFGAPWDTIRKWRRPLDAQLGPEEVAYKLRLAEAAASPSKVWTDYLPDIERDGGDYQAELRGAIPRNRRGEK